MSQHGLYGLQDLGWGVEVTDTSGTACWALGEETQRTNKRDKAFREDSLMKQVSQVQSEKRKPWKNGRREPGKLCLGVRDRTLNSRRREFHTQARRRAEEDGEVLLAVAALRTVTVTAAPCPLDDGEEGWRWLGLALGPRLLAAKQGSGKLDGLFL